jgi:diacylglycerol O-acyltransferase / wax synthase
VRDSGSADTSRKNRIPRLTRADLSNLRYETPAAPMHIGALLLVDAAPLVDAAGRLLLEEVRRRLELRLGGVPVLRRRLLRPGILRGRPLWVDDSAFSIDNHVRTVALHPDAADAEMVAAVERLMAAVLDRSRPLWELWLLTGLNGNRLAALLKLHHAIADGLAAVAILTSLFDFDPLAPDPPLPGRSPVPAPSPGALFLDNLSRASASAERAGRLLAHPGRVGRALRAAGGDLVRALRSPAAPRTSINKKVAPGRHIRFARFDLEAVSATAHAAGGKVNDVVLDLVAGGLSELLRGRGERVDGVRLIASVPVSLRTAAEAGVLGNAVGVMTVPLDIGQPDAQRRLDSIIAATQRAKRDQHPARVQAFMAWLAASPIAQAFIARQRLVNLFVTNVAGPPAPAYMLGARIRDVLPIVSPQGNVSLAFCAFSYAGCLYLVATVDATACPDVDRLIAGAQAAWRDLGEVHVRALQSPLV